MDALIIFQKEFGVMMRSSLYILILICNIGFAKDKNITRSSDKNPENIIGKETVFLKKAPNFLSATLKPLNYGDKVIVIKQKEKWKKVKHKKFKGWLHSSSLATNKNILDDIGKGRSVAMTKYQEDVALAGKGFSPTHEEHLKKSDKDLNFKDVDNILSNNTNFIRINRFAKKGKLRQIK
jgi:SH3-like domain-containing protein